MNLPYNNGSKKTDFTVGEGMILSSFCYIWNVWARHSDEGGTFSPIQPSFYSEITVDLGNMAMVPIDMYRKSP